MQYYLSGQGGRCISIVAQKHKVHVLTREGGGAKGIDCRYTTIAGHRIMIKPDTVFNTFNKPRGCCSMCYLAHLPSGGRLVKSAAARVSVKNRHWIRLFAHFSVCKNVGMVDRPLWCVPYAGQRHIIRGSTLF